MLDKKIGDVIQTYPTRAYCELVSYCLDNEFPKKDKQEIKTIADKNPYVAQVIKEIRTKARRIFPPKCSRILPNNNAERFIESFGIRNEIVDILSNINVDDEECTNDVIEIAKCNLKYCGDSQS